MPTFTHRNPRNASGLFYVDTDCIDCDLCRSLAPDIFTRDDDSGLSIVRRQPSTPDEVDQAREAISACPSESIGELGAAPCSD